MDHKSTIDEIHKICTDTRLPYDVRIRKIAQMCLAGTEISVPPLRRSSSSGAGVNSVDSVDTVDSDGGTDIGEATNSMSTLAIRCNR